MFLKLLFIPYRLVRYVWGGVKFGSFGWHTSIRKPLLFQNTKSIFLEDGVRVGKYSWLAASRLLENDSKLILKEGCTVGDFAHIYASKEIIIERKVLIANFVYIADNVHGYEDINVPIMHQNIVQKKPVRIGEGSWIGEHVCIIGANIGKHCVIGANSVVTHDIPDYSIAVGSPAKVIKKYNFETQKWEKV
jgi:acetyltransferase-like isoleucine patch superfamily enzyme